MKKVIQEEKKLDKELKDSFPASDPASGNVIVGAPDREDVEKAREKESGCGSSHKQ